MSEKGGVEGVEETGRRDGGMSERGGVEGAEETGGRGHTEGRGEGAWQRKEGQRKWSKWIRGHTGGR